MADRSVIVNLIANVGQYVAGMGRAGAATQAMARQAQTGATAASGAFTRAGGNVDKLAKGMAVGGAALAVGLGAAVKSSMDFDAQMAVVKANVDLGGVSFDKLKDTVKGAGTQFGFTAMESADAADDLAKAGLTASQIIGGGLTGALTLAAAGNISTGEAAETAATAMTMFGLKASAIPHIADLLAAGADKSTASVHSLSEGLMEGGSLAHLMGVSIEDTTAVLAEFDQSGLKGAKAGNALKTMFQNMLAPTKQQQQTMDKLNLSFFDANGKFIGLAGVAGELKDKLGGLTDQQRNAALSILFGARSIQAANILYKDGAKGVEDWEKKTNDAGFAAENARKKMDSLKGDLNKLKSAVIELAINGGAAATSFLRPLAEGSTHLLSSISALPTPILTVGTGLLALSSGGLLAAAATIKVVGAIQKTRTQFLAAKAAVTTYTSAQIAARAAARGTAEASAIQAGTMAATARNFTTSGAALVTLMSGQVIQVGRVGTAIAMMGRTAIPTLGALQVAYLSAAAGGSKLASAQLAATASAKGLGAVAAVVGVAFASVEVNQWLDGIGKSKTSVDGLAKSLQQLGQSGKVTGDLADMFRESGGALREFGIPIGPTTEKVVDLNDVMKRFADTANKALDPSMGDKFNNLGRWLTAGGSNMDDFKKQAKSIDEALAQLATSGHADQAAAAFKKLTSGIKDPKVLAAVKEAMPKFSAAMDQAAKSASKAVSPTQAAATAISDMGKKSKDSEDDVNALTSALKGLGDAQLGARGSARSYQQAIDDATDALKQNGKTLDITTAKGRDNQEKLDAIASSTTDWASSQYKLTNNLRQSNAILSTGKKQYVETAVAMGMSRDKAKALADQLFRMPKTVDTSVDVDGADDAIYKVDKLGNLVVSMNGKKVTIPADAPNAAQTANILYSVKDAATNAAGTKVTIPSKVIGDHETLDALLNIKGARLNADGSVQIPTKALDAKQTTDLLTNLGRVAVDADGKSVIIPASVPNAPKVIDLIKQIHGAQITANGKHVVITSSAPMADDTRRKINNIRGAQVSADGRHVTINSSVPNYGTVLGQIRAILAAAHDKWFTVTANYVTNHVDNYKKNFGKNWFAANGAMILAGGHRVMADGGFNSRQAMMAPAGSWITWAEDETGGESYIPHAPSKRARSVRILGDTAGMFGYDLVKRAADGYMSGWRDARPVTVVSTVPASGPTGGGLSDTDRALLRQSMQVSQKVLAAMPKAVESGLAGRKAKDAQSAHLARRAGGGF